MENNIPFEVIDSPTALDDLFKEPEKTVEGANKEETTFQEGSSTVDFNDPEKKDKEEGSSTEERVEKPEIKDKEDKTEEGEDKLGAIGVVFKNFKGLGLIEDEEGIHPKDVNEDKFVELYNSTIENRVKAQLDNFAKTLPEEAASLLSHLREGGKVEDFIETYADPLRDIDINESKDQERVISEWLRIQGYSNDEIKSELEDINDLGKTKLRAEKYLEKYNTFKQDQEKELESTRKEQDRLAKENYAQTVQKISDVIDKNDKILDFSFGKNTKLKQETKDYITKRNVRLPNGQVVTKYYADQMKQKQDWAEGNYDSYIANAILMMNGYKLDKVKVAAKTEAALSLKQELERSQKTPLVTKNKGENREEKPLPAESFDWGNLFGTNK